MRSFFRITLVVCLSLSVCHAQASFLQRLGGGIKSTSRACIGQLAAFAKCVGIKAMMSTVELGLTQLRCKYWEKNPNFVLRARTHDLPFVGNNNNTLWNIIKLYTYYCNALTVKNCKAPNPVKSDRGQFVQQVCEEVASDAIMYGISRAANLDSLNGVIDAVPCHPLAKFGLKVGLATGTGVAGQGVQRFVVHPALEIGKNVATGAYPRGLWAARGLVAL